MTNPTLFDSSYLDKFKSDDLKGKPKCQWQYAIDEVLKFMDDKKPGARGFWMKKLKGKDPSWILSKIQECKHAQKPQGMFYNHVVKGITKLDV